MVIILSIPFIEAINMFLKTIFSKKEKSQKPNNRFRCCARFQVYKVKFLLRNEWITIASNYYPVEQTEQSSLSTAQGIQFAFVLHNGRK